MADKTVASCLEEASAQAGENLTNYVTSEISLSQVMEKNHEMLRSEIARLQALRDDYEREVKKHKMKTTTSSYDIWLHNCNDTLHNAGELVDQLVDFSFDKPTEPVLEVNAAEIKVFSSIQRPLEQAPELPTSPNRSSLIALYLQEKYELTAIPPLFFQRIQVLDLSHTSIKSLPESLPKLVALKKLFLRGCQLFMELSPQVGELKNLEELDLDETQIMDLPREIGELLNLRHLTVSFYHASGKNKLKSNILIDPETISILSQLTELSIDVNPEDKRWDDSVEAVVKEVSKSKSLRTLSLYLPKFQLLHNTSFIYPSLSRFIFTVGYHERRIVSRVPREVEAEFRNWGKCLKFVNGESIPIEIKGVLNHSVSFFLDNHATARNLSEFGIENMKRLKFCLLADCDEMETLIDGQMHHERDEDNQFESDPGCIEYVLESLQYLGLYYMENLGSIWRGPNHYGCMCKLKFLAVDTCPQLSNIFSCTSIESFVNLEEIFLENCLQLTSLVSDAPVKPMPDKIFLPKLKRLLLLHLPELVSISNGLLIAPKLESIGFYDCPKLKSISKNEVSSKTLKIIKGECEWWEKMIWNETEWGNRPDYLMCIFSPIDDEKDVMTQLAEDRGPLEATLENEGQEPYILDDDDDEMLLELPLEDCISHRSDVLDDEILLEFPPEDHKSQWSEEKTTKTDVTKSTSSDNVEDATGLGYGNVFEALSQDKGPHPGIPEAYARAESQESVLTGESKTVRKMKESIQRLAFRTKSEVEELDDGCKWRKYGKKAVKNSPNLRNYYKCSVGGCNMKKTIERDTDDPSYVITTYQGTHNHDHPYFCPIQMYQRPKQGNLQI